MKQSFNEPEISSQLVEIVRHLEGALQLTKNQKLHFLGGLVEMALVEAINEFYGEGEPSSDQL